MSSDVLQPPFFVVDGHDVMVCETLESLEQFVEPVDAPETQAFDRHGRDVQFRVEGSSWRPVTVALAGSVTDPIELLKALRRFLRAGNSQVESLDLAEIVENLAKFGIKYS